MADYTFPAVFTHQDGEEISVVFPDLGVATSGVDDSDAFASAKELLAITILGMEDDDTPMPEPTEIKNIPLSSDENARNIVIDTLTYRRKI